MPKGLKEGRIISSYEISLKYHSPSGYPMASHEKTTMNPKPKDSQQQHVFTDSSTHPRAA